MSILSDALDRLDKYNVNPFSAENPWGFVGVGGMAANWIRSLRDIVTAHNSVADLAGQAQQSVEDAQDAAAAGAAALQAIADSIDGLLASSVPVSTQGRALVAASTPAAARTVIGVEAELLGKASLGENTFTADQNLGGHAAFNAAFKAVTASLNTSPTPNELTVDFKTGHKAAYTVTGNRKIIPLFPAGGGVGVLDLTNAGAFTITFSTGKKTAGGAAVTFTTSGVDRLTFIGTDSDYEIVNRKDIKA